METSFAQMFLVFEAFRAIFKKQVRAVFNTLSRFKDKLLNNITTLPQKCNLHLEYFISLCYIETKRDKPTGF